MVRRTTIGDVAKQAGVGKVTVSYVLNGRALERGISAATSQKVLDTAKSMNYIPNVLGQMLANQRTNTIAVVFQGVDYFASTSSFIPEVLRGVCEEGVVQGVDVMLHTKAAESMEADANYLASGRVDGALILRDAGDPLIKELKQRRFPIVSFFSRPEEPGIPYVDTDNYSGGRLAAQHLLSLGHRRFAVIAGSELSVDATDRKNGFLNTVRAAGLEIPAGNVLKMFAPLNEPEPLKRLMVGPDRPTALFVWSDDVAFQCITLVHQMGLSVPGDVSIVGFDSTPACDRVSPPLTSVRQPISTMARNATRILTEVMRGRAADLEQIVFPPQLDVRASTAPYSNPPTQ